jgi:ABC-type uncharacterized transport system involved in gliding motility auxiliary subunit
MASIRMALYRLGASRRARAWGALLCIGLMLIAVNIIAGRLLNARLDLTREGLYTLSRGTRQTVARIDEPITLRFYYSSRLGDSVPSYGVYAQRVRELLDEYVAAARGKLRLEIYNPAPFSDIEDRAVAFGLQAVPLDEQGEQVFFGLAGTNSTDDQQVIAFLAPDRERLLEYDLTRLVHNLAMPKRTVVGLVTSLPLEGDVMAAMRGQPMRPMGIIEQLRQLNRVETIGVEFDAVPPDIDVLMLVHPQNLPQKTLFAIDQFVLKGGKALVFVDPYSELQAGERTQPGMPADSELEPLFKKWGVRLLPNTVAGDRQNAMRVAVRGPGGAAQALDYVAWIKLRGADINREDVITAELKQLAMGSAGILEPVEAATTQIEPLVTTSPEAAKIPVDKIAPLPDVAGLLTGFKSDHTRYTLAARIRGPAETAFPDGPPKSAPAKPDAAEKPAEAATPPADFLRRSAQPINIVVVADTDMLDDRFWADTRDFFGRRVTVPFANNADFVANAIEVLAGGEDLIDLRSRGGSARPFTVVEAIPRAADERYAAEQRALQDKLKQTQQKLRELTGSEPANAANLSPEQARAIDEFRAEMVQTRQQLRAVQAALRQDIEWLKAILEFCDIALVPILVAVTAVVLGALRLRRRHRRQRQPALA